MKDLALIADLYKNALRRLATKALSMTHVKLKNRAKLVKYDEIGYSIAS